MSSIAADELVERREVSGVGALGGQRRDAELDGQAHVAGVAPAGRAARATGGSGGGGARRRTCRRRGRATACRWPLWASAVSAWRSVEREISEPRAQLALGRQPRARRQQAELDRRAEALERLLERRLGAHRREDGLEGGDRLQVELITAARSRGRAPSR